MESTAPGSSASPAPSGPQPRTSCRYSVATKEKPNGAASTVSEARSAERTVRFRNSPRGISGSAARRSTTTNATSRATAATARRHGQSGAHRRLRRLRHGQHEQQHARRAGHRAGQVDRPPAALRRRIPRQRPHRGEQHQRHDRHLDQEDPAPAQQVGEHAAQHEAHAEPGRRAGREHAQRPVPRGALGERRRDDRHRGRHRQRGTDALHATGSHQQPGPRREPRGQRHHPEQHQPAEEEPAAAVEIGGPAAEQQEPAVGERVAGGHPLQHRGRQRQLTLDARQRDLRDRQVEGVEQDRRAQHAEDEGRALHGRFGAVHSADRERPGGPAETAARWGPTTRMCRGHEAPRATRGPRADP